MDKNLELEVTFPFWLAYRANLQAIRWSTTQIVTSSVFPAMGLVLCYQWFQSQHALSLSNVLLLIGCFFFTPLVLIPALFLTRRRNALARGPFKFVFDDEGIHISNPAINMSLKWAGIQRVRESGSFIFFFVAPARAQTVALAQLRSAGILDDVRALALAKVKDTKLLRG